MKKYYLELQGLRKSYFDGSGDHHILKGADLNVEKGETVAILGSSGSGKSTLLNLIAGIDLPDQGEVRIDGKSLGQMSEKNRTLLRRRTMGFVFQSFNSGNFWVYPKHIFICKVTKVGIIDGSTKSMHGRSTIIQSVESWFWTIM